MPQTMPAANALSLSKFDECMTLLAGIPALVSLTDAAAHPVWQALLHERHYIGQTLEPAARLLRLPPGTTFLREGEAGSHSLYLVLAGRAEVFVRQGAHQTGELVPGLVFGELAVLAGMPQPTTVIAAGPDELVVLEVQRSALPLLRALPAFAAALDGAHRRHRHTLLVQELALLTRLDFDAAEHLSTSSRLHLHESGHELFRQGEPVHSLFVLRQGWGTLTLEQAGANQTQAFGAWQCFGLPALAAVSSWPQSCTLATDSETLEIQLAALRAKPEFLDEISEALGKLATSSSSSSSSGPSIPATSAQLQLLQTGLVAARDLTLIDARLCVRCGNCSDACRQMHGASRLNLRGQRLALPARFDSNPARVTPKQQPWFMPSVCVHCQTPACLPVCPSSAITRRPDGRVTIDEAKCIGCGDCATSCPHAAITLVPRLAVPEATEATDATDATLVAVQCNLCADTPLNPAGAASQLHACQENCPTGALRHAAPAQLAAVQAIPQFGQASASVAGSGATLPAIWLAHLVGCVSVAIGAGLAFWAALRFGLHAPLHGLGMNMRWLTGLVSLAALVATMAYGWRRRQVKRRLGHLRYWLIAHGYAAFLLVCLLAIHHGSGRGSALTTVLAIALYAALFAGLYMALLYRFMPRWLTRLESQPVLPEDLAARRMALRAELAELLVQAETSGVAGLREQALQLLRSRSWLVRQWWKNESLAAMVESAQARWVVSTADVTPENALLWQRAIAIAATVRRIDALLWLHGCLRTSWWPHVVTAGLFCALLLVHLLQIALLAR